MSSRKKFDNLKYFLNTTLIGFGCAPFLAAFCAASICVYIFIFLPKIVVWILMFFYFAKAAHITVYLYSPRLPSSFLARYLPVALPLVLTLVLFASSIVVNGSFAPEAFIVPLYFNIAFFLFGYVLRGFLSIYEWIVLAPLIYQAAYLFFFTINERRSLDRAPIKKKLVAAYFTALLACCAIIIWITLGA